MCNFSKEWNEKGGQKKSKFVERKGVYNILLKKKNLPLNWKINQKGEKKFFAQCAVIFLNKHKRYVVYLSMLQIFSSAPVITSFTFCIFFLICNWNLLYSKLIFLFQIHFYQDQDEWRNSFFLAGTIPEIQVRVQLPNTKKANGERKEVLAIWKKIKR